MFSREVRLREAMKRIIAVMWQSGVPPAASGYTANDIIIGLESGGRPAGALHGGLLCMLAHVRKCVRVCARECVLMCV